MPSHNNLKAYINLHPDTKSNWIISLGDLQSLSSPDGLRDAHTWSIHHDEEPTPNQLLDYMFPDALNIVIAQDFVISRNRSKLALEAIGAVSGHMGTQTLFEVDMGDPGDDGGLFLDESLRAILKTMNNDVPIDQPRWSIEKVIAHSADLGIYRVRKDQV